MKKYIFSSKFTQKSRKPAYTNKHSISFAKMVKNLIEQADILLEVLDARFVEKTRNRELEAEVRSKGKTLIFVLNKADLIDVGELKLNYELESLKPYALVSSKSKIGRSRLRDLIAIEASRLKRKNVFVGILGYPNTGKSSLINVLCGGKLAGTSPGAGFTQHIQKIRFRDGIYILDSPGIITGGEENSIDERIVKRQTEIGAKDYNKAKYPDLILNEIMIEEPRIFDEFYNVKSNGDVEVLIEELGKKWNFLKKGGEIDSDRVARRILRDWQEGKIVVKSGKK
jgi:ribosome biogenesis GTPase A